MQESGLLLSNVGRRKDRLVVRSDHIIGSKFTETEIDQRVPGTSGRRRGVTANVDRISFWGDEHVLKLDSADGGTTLQIY